MDKNKLLQEIRILIIVVASATIGWFGCLEYQKYQSEKNLPKPIEENNTANLKSANVKKQTNTSINTNLNKTAPTLLYCPTITSALNYEFKWQKDWLNNNAETLYLSNKFLNETKYSDGFHLNNTAIPGLSYKCEIGSKAGENINKLYCKTTDSPIISKKTTDARGNIVKTDELYITAFVFNIEGKNLNNASELKSLKSNSINCSSTQQPRY